MCVKFGNSITVDCADLFVSHFSQISRGITEGLRAPLLLCKGGDDVSCEYVETEEAGKIGCFTYKDDVRFINITYIVVCDTMITLIVCNK